MIGIKHITSYIPADFIDNFEQGEKFGESRDYIINKIGAHRLPRKLNGQETSDLACCAIEKLLKECTLSQEKMQALVVVTQNGDGYGLPHTSAIVHKKLGLCQDVATFDVSLGCSGYVYGLAILKGFLQASGLKSGMLVTADPYSKIIDPTDRITTLLFGDAATATWLGEDALWDVGRPTFMTDSYRGCHLAVNKGKLQMNGWQIFNFAATNVPSHINKMLDAENLTAEDVDCFFVHQGTAAIVEAIAKKFPTVRERFILDLSTTGNTVSSSIPILLEKYYKEPSIKRVLLSGFGVGLSLATILLDKREERYVND